MYDDAASTPDDATAIGGKSGVRSAAGAAGARKEKRFPGIPEGTDSAKEGPPSTSGAPSTPDASVAGAAPPRSTAPSQCSALATLHWVPLSSRTSPCSSMGSIPSPFTS